MPNRLPNRVALITGSSSGIGRATALLFASEGATVVCADLTETSWREPGPAPDPELSVPTHALILSRGGRAHFTRCDVTSPSSVAAAVASAVSSYGRLDIMINNAGIAIGASDGPGRGTPVWELEEEDFARQQEINVKGVFYGIKYAARHMIAQTPVDGEGGRDRGRIINAASVLGLVGSAGGAAYCTSKGAVVNLTRSAALDCAPFGVSVNAVNPGFVRTRLTDTVLGREGVEDAVARKHVLGGIGEAEDVARAYLFLASEDSRWMTGVNLPVDGGYLAH